MTRLIYIAMYFLPGVLLAIFLRRLMPWTWLRLSLEFLGCAVHEFLHWGCGFLLGAKPIKGTVLPKKVEGGWILGSVTFSNIRWYNGFLTSLAPLLIFAIFATLVPKDWLSKPITEVNLMMWLAMGLLLPAGIPSKQDIRVAFKSAWLLLAAGALILFLIFF